MTAISDGVVIGVVLGLIFAAVCYYLYSRVNQLERKVGLMENILLDLKVAQQSLFTGADPVMEQGGDASTSHEEFHQYREAIAEASASVSAEGNESYRPPTPPSYPTDQQDMREVPLDGTPRSRPSQQQPITITREEAERPEQETTTSVSNHSSVSVNYESMTYKELNVLAKSLGITGLRNQSKAFIIDAIRRHVSGKGPASPKADTEPSGLTNWTKSSLQFEEGQGTQSNTFQTLDQVGNIELDSAQDVTFGGTAIEETNVAHPLEMMD